MAISTINSRIILHNDTSANWQSSDKILLKGELALAEYEIDGETKFDLRIGNGTSKWRELSPTNLLIPATAISGIIATKNMPGTTIYKLSANEDNTQITLVSASSDSQNEFATVGDTLIDIDLLSTAYDNIATGSSSKTLTSLTYDTANNKVSASYVDISIATSQINDFDANVSAIANDYTQELSGLLSDAWSTGGLSAISKDNENCKILLSSDITGLTAKVQNIEDTIGDIESILNAL